MAQLSEKEQEKIDRELWESAEAGHLEKVKEAIQKGANFKNRQGNTLFGYTTPHTIACIKGYNTIVEFLEITYGTPDYTDVLWAATQRGLVDIVQKAIEKKANINFQNQANSHQTVLHIASKGGHSEIVEVLLKSKADPNICDQFERTPLFPAAQKGYVDTLKLLIQVGQANVNATDKKRQTPAHLAAKEGHVDTLKLLIEEGRANVNAKDKDGYTPAHYAAEKGHVDALKVLIVMGQADVNAIDKRQWTALHLASMGGYSEVVKLLLEFNADPNIYSKLRGRTSVQYAAENGHVDTLKILIEVGNADINATDREGNNLLHLACRSGSKDAIHYLLHNTQLDPVALNNNQHMPLDCIPQSNRFQLLKLFQPFQQCHRNYLTESYAKIFFCGKTTAGKSSLAAVISYRANRGQYWRYDPEECVQDVVSQTTGIDYHSIRSWEIGDVIMFDFAGHAEYYSSHAAVLETLLLRSSAVFVIVSKLTDDEESIKKDLLFWFNFVENASSKLISSSQIVVVGSHIDQLPSKKDFQPFVNNIANQAIRFQNYKGFLTMDCHRVGGKDVETFMEKLKESCEAVVDENDKMSYHCHCLNSYLQQLEEVAISLDELCSKLRKLNEPCLLTDRSTVLELLTVLGSKGLILFLANTWVIINKNALLTEVNGVLFNKTIDRVRKPVASNIGIMPVSTLANLFRKHNTDMLIGFLTSLQFCHQMNSLAVSSITNNVLSDDSALSKDEKYLFFPALITEEKPSQVFETTDGFGWCLWCPESQQFLSMRFLHTLLHRLAFTCCPPPPEEAAFITENLAIQELHRVCTMWKNGIYWKEENMIEVMVEVTEDNRCVTILVSHSSLIESYKLRASLIKEVLSLKSELCPCTAKQFIIAPGNVKDVMDKEQANRIVYSLREAAKGVLARVTVTSTNNDIVDVQLVVGKKEPYRCIVPLLTKALFTDTNKDLQLPDHYVQHIREVCSEIMSSYPSSDFTYLTVREHLNQYSIFAGRNPFSIPSPRIKDEVIQRLSKHVQSKTIKDSVQPDTKSVMETMSSSACNVKGNSQKPMLAKATLTDEFIHFPKLSERPTRREVLIQLACIDASWRSIGNGLGVSFNFLQGLAESNHSNQVKLDQVIQRWQEMDGKDEGAAVTWSTIFDVVKGPLVQNKTLAMRIYDYLKQESYAQQSTQIIVAQTDKNRSNEEKNDVDYSVSESITEDNKTVHAKCDASKIFRIHSADLCDIIVDANPHRMVNRLVSADLLPQDMKEDVRNTTDVYDKADKIVEKLQTMIDDNENPPALLKKTCDFLSKQNDKTLKEIGAKMLSQL